MGKAQANFKLKPGPSLATSEKLKPKPWWCSNFYSIKDSIFWSLLKKSSLSLDQARAILKLLNWSLPKETKPRLEHQYYIFFWFRI